MIDEHNASFTGWARFSDDRRQRYRLARALTPSCAGLLEIAWSLDVKRVVFLMVNPSLADAFRPDNTVTKCCQFALQWNADMLEVVNLFALRSTDPRGLDEPGIDRGDGPDNDEQIIEACTGATRVIAAWGNNGWRGGRGLIVRDMLARRGIQLEHFGMTREGYPLHPLARGKAFIPLTREPEVWT